jgi:hypothetical protein
MAHPERTGLEPVSLRDPEMSSGLGLTALSCSLLSGAAISLKAGEVNHAAELAKLAYTTGRTARRLCERCMDMSLERSFLRHQRFISESQIDNRGNV